MRRLVAAFRRWRERQRQYKIQRALYKQGGGALPPSMEANMRSYGPPTVTHDRELSELASDE